MQSAINDAFPLALGIFEPGEFENELIEAAIFKGEKELQARWLEKISAVISSAGLVLPDISKVSPVYGGRKGFHSEYLQPLLDEMTEVFSIDPEADW
jgi:ring-1,2-phenylacetyl-CoA epoxidase subunit PaaC